MPKQHHGLVCAEALRAVKLSSTPMLHAVMFGGRREPLKGAKPFRNAVTALQCSAQCML